MDLAEYMLRRCVCGRLRRDHQHYRTTSGQLRVLPHRDPRHCPGFIDAIEIELLETAGRPPPSEAFRPLAERHVMTPDATELAVSHGPKCNCLPCIRIWDYSVACTECGVAAGEDCQGLGSSRVHFPRRMLGLFERKDGKGSMSHVIADVLRSKFKVVQEPS